MTEAEWLQQNDSRRMFAFIGERMSRRQCRVFTHACGRRYCQIWEEGKYSNLADAAFWLPRKPEVDSLCSRILDAAECELDGGDRQNEIETLRRQIFQEELAPIGLNWDISSAVSGEVSAFVTRLGELPSTARGQAMMDTKQFEELAAEHHFQAVLLRDIIPNPFRPAPTIDPAWLTWNDSLIPQMAQHIYEQRKFEDLPILSDALLDAGCTNQDIIDHCRSKEPHVRGCWVVDLLLRKE